MKIIGFGHRKRVGKDTAAKFALAYMRQTYPHLRCHILSFGNEIKNIAHRMYKWGDLQDAIYYENNPDQREVILPKIGRTPRQIWDEIGLMGRGISVKTWIELAMHHAPVEADILFCKDLRAHTEIELVDLYKGWSIRIDRDAPKGGPIDELLSEHTFDRVIDNNGSRRDLNDQVKRLCNEAVSIWNL